MYYFAVSLNKKTNYKNIKLFLFLMAINKTQVKF